MKNINLFLVVLLVLSFIILNILLKTKVKNNYLKIIINVLYLSICFFGFSYMNGIIQSIFKLKYLGVKLYLSLLIVVNAIVIYTINVNIRKCYKLINYLLFVIIGIVFGCGLSVILGNKVESFYLMDISNAVNFIDLSFVIFMIYLVIVYMIYLGFYLFSKKEFKEEIKHDKVNLISKIKDAKKREGKVLDKQKISFSKVISFKKKKASGKKMNNTLLAPEEILSLREKRELFINGVECSIIFEDSNKDNIVKNYYILSNDINAKMANGYTLKENKMLKQICLKLEVSNLYNVDIYNISILNKISIDEYKLLQKVLGVR